MYANTDSQSYQDNWSASRGRGQGGRFARRGRGRGHNGGYRDKFKVVCYRCDKMGHYASDCPDRLLKLQEAQESENGDTQQADALMMHELVYINEKNVQPNNLEANSDIKDMWYFDNGASNHMTGNKSYFSELNKNVKGKVKFGDGSCVEIEGKGSILFQSKTYEQILVKDIYYIPDLKSNILSLGQATEVGCDFRMRQNYLTVHDPSERFLVKVMRSPNRLYKIGLKIGRPVCLNRRVEDDTWKWHAKLGHVSFKTIKMMFQQGMVHVLPEVKEEKKLFESCMVGKQTRQAFPNATMFRASKPLELLHADLCGPITSSTLAHNRYIFVIVDDFSRYMWSILLKEKSEDFCRFKAFKSVVENDLGKEIMTLRTDRGGEFTSKEFNDFCDTSGIKRHLTLPYTPQQNGVVERRNRTLMEMTRSMLKAMKVPNMRWGEVIDAREGLMVINNDREYDHRETKGNDHEYLDEGKEEKDMGEDTQDNHDNEGGEAFQGGSPLLRRICRQVFQPRYLEDYVL